MNHREVHNQIRRVLAEATDEVAVQLTGGDGWFQMALKDRVSLLRKLVVYLDDSVLVNHKHFSLLVVSNVADRFTMVTAEVARLKQEVRIYEQELLMSRNKNYVDDVAADLKDKFKQMVFEAPTPQESDV